MTEGAEKTQFHDLIRHVIDVPIQPMSCKLSLKVCYETCFAMYAAIYLHEIQPEEMEWTNIFPLCDTELDYILHIWKRNLLLPKIIDTNCLCVQ